MSKYFGTDGIRGKVGAPPLTPDGTVRLARAFAMWIADLPVPASRGSGRHLVLIAGDTRSSTPWITDILSGTLVAHGVDVCPLHVAATPELAFETGQSAASAGIMVTASHNPATDNGVKLFGADGFKLSSDDQARIEDLIDAAEDGCAAVDQFGVIDDRQIEPRYVDHLKGLDGLDLQGLKLVVDAAHGAASENVRRVFEGLGAEPSFVGVRPDGVNINDGVGATHPETLADSVLETGAFAGVALDGDADRLIMVDETGRVVDGDQLIALLATDLHARGTLEGTGVAATVMSNLGLERYLADLGIDLVRTPVGDRHVVEAMRARGLKLGGEQSGHIVMLDHGTTGDGLLAALFVLSIAKARGGPFSEVSRVFEPVPQKLVNVRFEGRNPLEDKSVQDTIRDVEDSLDTDGRVLVRKSGTEPLIRIMVEAVDAGRLEQALAALEHAVRGAA